MIWIVKLGLNVSFSSGDNPEDAASDGLSDDDLNIITYTIKETTQQGSFFHSTKYSILRNRNLKKLTN